MNDGDAMHGVMAKGAAAARTGVHEAFLPDAPPALRERLAEAARSLKTRRGQLVLTSGSSSDDVYMILAGTMRVTLFSSTGREIAFRELGAGDMFGELAAIDRGLRSATIMAGEDGLLATIGAPAFRAAIAQVPEAGLWLAQRLARQIRSLTERVYEQSALSVRSRIHCELLRMCADAGVADNRTELTRMPTHDMLAARIGTHREAVTREIGYLGSIGILSAARRQVHVHDVARLAGLVTEATGENYIM